MSRTLRTVSLAAMCGLLVATPVRSVQAHEPSDPARKGAIQLDDKSGSSFEAVTPSKRSAAELRQMRALRRQQYRDARIEAAKNAGYHLSRPPAPAVPSTTSRYQYARPWFVPIYVYPRY